MNQESDHSEWPQEAGDRSLLPREMAPPDELENRVARSLLERGLIRADDPAAARRIGWRAMRASLAMAACVAFVAIGVVIGRTTIATGEQQLSPLTGAETDLYALLLYESEGYDRAVGAEALTRYGEYGRWIAEARERRQFVTGEDLEVSRGWLVGPANEGVVVEQATSIAGNAPLSGIFFIRAADPAAALELARELPHVRHGGQVLVQKTIPTDQPPDVSP